MAITGLHYQLLRQLQSADILPQGGTILELGEANWYGDTNPAVLRGDAIGRDKAVEIYDAAMSTGLDIGEVEIGARLFALAKVVYEIVMAPSKIVSIDFHGTPAALKLDLNREIRLNEDGKAHDPLWNSPRAQSYKFDCVFNHGTLEHLFNAAEGYRTMHNHCKVGGLLIHESPLTGWFDHGLLHPQPGLFFDLSLANKYEIILYAIECLKEQKVIQIKSREELHKLASEGKLPDNSMSFVVFRKTADQEFQIPIQGLYAGTISRQAQESWRTMR